MRDMLRFTDIRQSMQLVQCYVLLGMFEQGDERCNSITMSRLPDERQILKGEISTIEIGRAQGEAQTQLEGVREEKRLDWSGTLSNEVALTSLHVKGGDICQDLGAYGDRCECPRRPHQRAGV